jgi:hypothetical protein
MYVYLLSRLCTCPGLGGNGRLVSEAVVLLEDAEAEGLEKWALVRNDAPVAADFVVELACFETVKPRLTLRVPLAAPGQQIFDTTTRPR